MGLLFLLRGGGASALGDASDFLDEAGFSTSPVSSVGGPNPKNTPGKERGLEISGALPDAFLGGRPLLTRLLPLRKEDLLSCFFLTGLIGAALSSINQSSSGQATGILLPSMSSTGSR